MLDLSMEIQASSASTALPHWPGMATPSPVIPSQPVGMDLAGAQQLPPHSNRPPPLRRSSSSSSAQVQGQGPVVGVQSGGGGSGVATRPAVPRYGIRSDVDYDPVSNVLTAVMELPGVRRNDLRVVLEPSRINRVKQVRISGEVRPVPFSNPFVRTASAVATPGAPHQNIGENPQMTVRERKYGQYFRAWIVPWETRVSSFPFSMPLSLSPTGAELELHLARSSLRLSLVIVSFRRLSTQRRDLFFFSVS
jgi:hypothetical protein